jgi:hypothetical protein
MNIKNRPPVLVPAPYAKYMEQFSKAFFMDLAWHYAQMHAKDEGDSIEVYEGFLAEAEIIELVRKGEYEETWQEPKP